jgi:hypothetical protein
MRRRRTRRGRVSRSQAQIDQEEQEEESLGVAEIAGCGNTELHWTAPRCNVLYQGAEMVWEEVYRWLWWEREGETDRHSGSRRGGGRIGATLTEMGGGEGTEGCERAIGGKRKVGREEEKRGEEICWMGGGQERI